ncbi:hypothetical protein [Belnapia rosea]|nr:hypothetical protein [Belnapia rosea]
MRSFHAERLETATLTAAAELAVAGWALVIEPERSGVAPAPASIWPN